MYYGWWFLLINKTLLRELRLSAEFFFLFSSAIKFSQRTSVLQLVFTSSTLIFQQGGLNFIQSPITIANYMRRLQQIYKSMYTFCEQYDVCRDANVLRCVTGRRFREIDSKPLFLKCASGFLDTLAAFGNWK